MGADVDLYQEPIFQTRVNLNFSMYNLTGCGGQEARPRRTSRVRQTEDLPRAPGITPE